MTLVRKKNYTTGYYWHNVPFDIFWAFSMALKERKVELAHG